MTELPTVEQAEIAARDARLKLQSIQAIVDEEKRKAAAEIDRKHAEIVSAARAEAHAAEQALREAKGRTPEHPWTGKRVVKMKRVGDRWSRREEPIYGVVEMRKIDTMFPTNTSRWRLPDIGKPFVRLLKKDGTPGSQFAELTGWYSGHCEWTLSEEEPRADSSAA